MIRHPNPGRTLGIQALRILCLTLTLAFFSKTSAIAADLHHFTIEKPEVITANQPARFIITAKSADKKTLATAKSKITVTFTARQLNSTQEATLKNGKATVTTTFDHAMHAIMTVADKNNPDLFVSEPLKIVPDTGITPREAK